jgi:hypothetical protein
MTLGLKAILSLSNVYGEMSEKQKCCATNDLGKAKNLCFGILAGDIMVVSWWQT